MKDYIVNSSSNFTKFLQENINQLKPGHSQTLVSYHFPVDKVDLKDRLDSLCKNQEVFFYSEKPFENKKLLGINSISNIKEKGEKRFSSLEKQIKNLVENFITNSETEGVDPLLLGGMKFTVEHADDDWKDFNDSDWFIPELLYIEDGDSNFLVYNTFISTKLKSENIKIKFEKILNQFFLTSDKEINKELRVLRSTGNEPKDKKKWKTLVTQLLDKIEDGELQKIVLSRKVELTFTTDISIEPILNSLKINYPECTLFIYHNGRSSFIGASPETLARFDNEKMHIEVLAGSADRGINLNDDVKLENDLLNNDKNLNEHNFVVDYVKARLEKSINTFEVSSPSIKKLKNIQHIKTTINFDLNKHNSSINILGKIHPTPAVCGIPADSALELIKKFEPHQRGMYAGLVGWLNLKNEGEMVLAIRSALITGNKLIAYAGCGIVKGSNPETEFKETELKLKPFLSIFINEN